MWIVAIVVFAGVALSHMAPFPFLLEAFRPKQSLWRMPAVSGAPAVYLTFDDGPSVEWTPRVLDALRAEGARATFFLIDEHVTTESEPIVRRMAADGHALALHSGSRKPVVMDPPALAARLTAAADRLAAITGQRPCRLFRPHAGWRSSTMYQALASIDYRLAGWSWGLWDWSWWRTPRGAEVAARLQRKAKPGDIIVIHDGHHRDPRADRRHAGEVVRALVPALRGRGFSFERLCDPVAAGS